MHALNSERGYERVVAERARRLPVCDRGVTSEGPRKIDAGEWVTVTKSCASLLFNKRLPTQIRGKI